MNDGPRPNCRVTREIDMSDQSAAVTDAHIRADRAIWADRNGLSNRGPDLDPSRRVDHRGSHASESMAPPCAPATIWPATFASPRYHHIDLRRVMRSM